MPSPHISIRLPVDQIERLASQPLASRSFFIRSAVAGLITQPRPALGQYDLDKVDTESVIPVVVDRATRHLWSKVAPKYGIAGNPSLSRLIATALHYQFQMIDAAMAAQPRHGILRGAPVAA